MSRAARQLGAPTLAALLSLLLMSCAGKPSRVEEPQDGPSTLDLRAEDVADAVPRAEPLAR